jgi:hypothetical protein
MLGSSSWMPYAPQGVKGTDDDVTPGKLENDNKFLGKIIFSD